MTSIFHLEGFKIPKGILFGEVPKTSTVIVQKFDLRKLAQRECDLRVIAERGQVSVTQPEMIFLLHHTTNERSSQRFILTYPDSPAKVRRSILGRMLAFQS